MERVTQKLEARKKEILTVARQANLIKEKTLLKWHGKINRNVILLERDFSFTNKKVLDIGSNYGNSLLYWGEGSVGIEIEEQYRKFIDQFGYKTISQNVEDSFSIDDKFEAVYSSNIIEHLVSPHLFLARIYSLLKENGMLAISHPITPIYPFDRIWAAVGYRGWLANEHINFFSMKGIYYTLQRAGFEIIKQYPKPFERIGLDRFEILSQIAGAFSIDCLTVCRKANKYKYPPQRLKIFDPSWGKDLDVFHGE